MVEILQIDHLRISAASLPSVVSFLLLLLRFQLLSFLLSLLTTLINEVLGQFVQHVAEHLEVVDVQLLKQVLEAHLDHCRLHEA